MCEIQSFGNFWESLRGMMAQHGDWTRGTPFQSAFVRFLDELFPGMEEKERFAELCRAFDTGHLNGVVITLKEVSFIKLFCDIYFLFKIQPKGLKALTERDEETDGKEAAE
jgi:hypothetical protein